MIIARILLAVLLTVPAFVSAEEGYPSRPIRVVVPFAPGSSLDFLLRTVSERFQENTGQPLILDHRGGGSGIIAAQLVANAPPDGYTVMTALIGQMSLNPLVLTRIPYDPDTSFVPVTQLMRSQYIFVGREGLPPKNLKDFIAWAKERPNKISYASTIAGGPGHFAGEMLNQAAGLSLIHVPYKGGGPAMNDLLGGHVDTFFTTIGISGEHLRGGKLTLYAVTSEHRIPALPDVPTFVELGYPSIVAYVWSGLVAPAGTPDGIVNKLYREIARVLQMPDVRKKLLATDQEPVGSSPQDFAAFMKADRKRWAAAVKASGFKAEQ